MSDLAMTRGDSRTFLFVLDADITDALGVWMTAKSAYADADPGVFQKSLDSGITVVDETTGTIQVDVEPGDTSDLDGTTNRLVFDVQVEDVDNKVTTFVRGKLIVRPDVTTSLSGS